MKDQLLDFPVIAILRGIQPKECESVAENLIESGIRNIEVPLNSPSAMASIERLVQRFSNNALIGAGTVTTEQQVRDLNAINAKLIVSPNCDPRIIRLTKSFNLISIPGCATTTEAFSALANGADYLKMFPCTMISPSTISAIRSVLPTKNLIAVGGIDHSNMRAYLKAGCIGLGFGSSLYQPNRSIDDIRITAKNIISTFQEFTQKQTISI